MVYKGNPIKMDDDWGHPHFRKPPLGLRVLREVLLSPELAHMPWTVKFRVIINLLLVFLRPLKKNKSQIPAIGQIGI